MAIVANIRGPLADTTESETPVGFFLTPNVELQVFFAHMVIWMTFFFRICRDVFEDIRENMRRKYNGQVQLQCDALQRTATLLYCKLQRTATQCKTLQRTATHCNILQHTASHCITLLHTASHCITLPHTATHCNILQHAFGTERLAATKSCHTQEWVMSHMWTSHATHVIEPWHTYERIWHWMLCCYELVSHTRMNHAAHVNESHHACEWTMAHIRMSRATHTNKSCHTYEWIMSHIWMSLATHMNRSCHTCESFISYHTCEWVMTHVYMRHTTTCVLANLSWHAYNWVMVRIRMSPGIHVNEPQHTSCYKCEWVVPSVVYLAVYACRECIGLVCGYIELIWGDDHDDCSYFCKK